MSFEHDNENDDQADPESLDVVTDEAPAFKKARKALVPPPDYTSRAIRLRLLTLVVTLGLVIIAMREAGKPERWKWMGFDEPAGLKAAPTDDRSTKEPGIQPNDSDTASITATERALSDRDLPDAALSEDNYPAAAVRFWAIMIRKMDSRQHHDLFRFLRGLRTGQPIEALSSESYEKLVTILKQQRKIFHRDLLDQIALLPDGSPDKKKLANELFESEQVWDKKILPAFNASLAGEDFTVSQLQQLQRLQVVLDPLVFAVVADHTSIGWDGDSAAWVRMWERIVNGEAGKSEPLAVTHLQLSSQPEFYRGRFVSVGGWVRSARREPLNNSELGVSHYYQLIVRPADSKVSPYCIYALDLPPDFPPVSDRYSNFNQRIEASGLFFKIRTYIDSAKEVSESPVLLASSVVVMPDAHTMPTTISAATVSPSMWLAFFTLLTVVAAGIAWWAFRSSETHRFEPGRNATEKINQSLLGLAHDPNVQTDAEKIRDLYE